MVVMAEAAGAIMHVRTTLTAAKTSLRFATIRALATVAPSLLQTLAATAMHSVQQLETAAPTIIWYVESM